MCPYLDESDTGTFMKTLRIAFADDHPIVLAGLSNLIANDPRFILSGTLATPTALVQHITQHRPDIVVTDFSMPGDEHYGDGLSFIGYLVRNFPATRLLVLTMITSPPIIASLYRAGVSGVVLKSDQPHDLLEALDCLYDGKRYLREDQPRDLAPEPHSDTSNGSTAQHDRATKLLSPKELEVLRLFIAGHSLTHIAQTLNRSIKTISNQKRSAMRKLDLPSDQALIEFCVHAGLFR